MDIWIKGLLILGIITFFNHCQQKEVEQEVTEKQPKLEKKVVNSNCEIKFQHKEGAIFVKLEQIDSLSYQLIWGNDDFQREIEEEFYCKQISDWEQCDFTPKLIEFTSDNILLKSVFETPSTGNCSPLTYKYWQLPLNNQEAVYTKNYFIQKINQYLIFNKDEKALLIRNIDTEKEQIIELVPKPYIEFKALDHSIDTIIINKNKLNVTYLKGTHQDYEKTTQAFDLKI